jgi:threonine/homoserine/homoserine lactone efflux protein
MPDAQALALFSLAALALLVTPGPAVLFVVTRSVRQGRAAGLVSTLGLGAGGLVHVLAATVGLSALLASSAAAFTAVKLLGAAYLLYLGVRALLSREEPTAAAGDGNRGRRHGRLFLDGFLVNALNPKAALFFLAFLPQFVDPAGAPVELQLSVLGLVYVGLALLTDGLYALAAGSLRGWLAARPSTRRLQRWLTAAVYVGLGTCAALAQPGGD